jgi:hypothetical protein
MSVRIRTIQVRRLNDDSPHDGDRLRSPAGRLSVVWDLTMDAWAFKGGFLAEPRLPRHVVRVERRRG